MNTVIITGSAGLIGSEATRFFHAQGFNVIGIDNDMRAYFFGEGASTQWNQQKLESGLHLGEKWRSLESGRRQSLQSSRR